MNSIVSTWLICAQETSSAYDPSWPLVANAPYTMDPSGVVREHPITSSIQSGSVSTAVKTTASPAVTWVALAPKLKNLGPPGRSKPVPLLPGLPPAETLALPPVPAAALPPPTPAVLVGSGEMHSPSSHIRSSWQSRSVSHPAP